MKNGQFKKYLAVCVNYSRFLGRIRSGLYQKCINDKGVVCSCMPNCF